MGDLTVALGLVLVIEGLVWALAPQAGVHLLAAAAETPQKTLRTFGWLAVATGVALVWLIRG
ncbi:MAG: DUF2065 domain-containing protein [Alphaproteobacteria bacterium]|nr:DUF2065 domain-containing protein [Alphaproteobacteria bacterium]